MKTIIRQASIVNENKITVGDVLIVNKRIEKIASHISLDKRVDHEEINAEGLFLFPGMIDDQVHFREPGLTHKATIRSESMAAVAGGITSFMDMPNTIPNTLTLDLLEEKYSLASGDSLANYSFFMGISKNNLDEALKIDNEIVCGITDDGLYFNDDEGIIANKPDFLEKLFSRSENLIALHSEDDSIISSNTIEMRKIYGDDIPSFLHTKIRSPLACIEATKRVIEISKKHNNRLHFFHISTLDEALLFNKKKDIREKRITAEACVHHLFFNETDYETYGNKIKWNPSIKTENDRTGLINALIENQIDIIATDHAPHTWDEKTGNYFQAKSGGPLVQHALVAVLELFHQGKISLEKIVEKTSHHVVEIYRLKERGYIREGYFADLVLIDLNKHHEVNKANILYKCKWSPFEGKWFKSTIRKTFVNGNLVYSDGKFNMNSVGSRLMFEKHR